MNLGIMTMSDAEKALIRKSSTLNQIVEDIDFKQWVKDFILKKGYDLTKSFNDNWNKFITYCGMRKALDFNKKYNS